MTDDELLASAFRKVLRSDNFRAYTDDVVGVLIIEGHWGTAHDFTADEFAAIVRAVA